MSAAYANENRVMKTKGIFIDLSTFLSGVFSIKQSHEPFCRPRYFLRSACKVTLLRLWAKSTGLLPFLSAMSLAEPLNSKARVMRQFLSCSELLTDIWRGVQPSTSCRVRSLGVSQAKRQIKASSLQEKQAQCNGVLPRESVEQMSTFLILWKKQRVNGQSPYAAT